jgi:hypothetical protein
MKVTTPLLYSGAILLTISAFGKKPEGVDIEQAKRDRGRMAGIGSGLLLLAMGIKVTNVLNSGK